jgi:hypothetical protein
MDDAPSSLIKADMVSWAVARAGYAERQSEATATDAAQIAYDWLAQRAGMLDPDQQEAQQAACEAHVSRLVRAQASIVGSMLLLFVLSAIVKAIVTVLLTHLFRSSRTLSAWQTLHVPKT